MDKPRVVILGGGFGGLSAAHALGEQADVTVVDRNNYQTFLPLLYQVSTASLAIDDVAFPLRGALRKDRTKFRMGSPISIDHKNKTVKLDSSEVLPFDYLIVALGSVTADFGIPGADKYTLGMKSVHESVVIRSTIMRNFEDLCRFQDSTRLKIVVVGGGPTGVEMSGAIAELVRGPLKGDDLEAARKIDVYIVEAGPRLLPMFAESLTTRTKKDLERLGVNVLLNTAVSSVEHGRIKFASGESIETQLVIWAAGVQSSPVVAQLNIPMVGGRIATDNTLQVTHYPYIFAVGDVAGVKGANGRFLPQIAPVALQQGRFAAKQILRLAKSQKLTDFHYVDKGAMATIGRHKAVIQVKGIKLSGPIAWFGWLFLHLFYLLGGLNKVSTIANWTWNYFTFDRANRHIFDSFE